MRENNVKFYQVLYSNRYDSEIKFINFTFYKFLNFNTNNKF